MKIKKIYIYLLMAFIVCAFATGCASKSSKPYKQSGFLSDYSRLGPDEKDKHGKIFMDPAVDFKQYDKVLLDRIMVYYKENSKHKGIDPTELKMLTDYFHDAIVRELGDAYPVVTEPGPGILRARIAITEMVPAKPSMSVIVLVTPYATAADLASGAISSKDAGSPPYLGDTAIEVELLDSETNEQRAAYVERRLPKKYNIASAEEGGVKTYAKSYLDSYTEWNYTKTAFDFWAKDFRTRMDESRGIKAPERNGEKEK